ncbi:MAG: CRISPR-associated RAMP protein Csx7 [Clostridiales bacterium]
MFRELINEAKIELTLELNSPLCIRTGGSDLFDPNLPDMQCLKTNINGEKRYIIPGSTLKGVIRSRYEKIIELFGMRNCDILDNKSECNNKESFEKITNEKGKNIYKKICDTCKFFGCGNMSSRIKFKDLHTIENSEVYTSIRNGVAINRITGAAKKGALYEYEVVDEATFKGSIFLNNFEAKQLKLLMFVLRDIDEGYISMGSSTSRGNGDMRVKDINFKIKDFNKNDLEKENNNFKLSNIDSFEMKKINWIKGNEELYYYYSDFSKENMEMDEFIENRFGLIKLDFEGESNE